MGKKQTNNILDADISNLNDEEKFTGLNKFFKTYWGLVLLVISFIVEAIVNIILKPFNIFWVWLGWVANIETPMASVYSSIFSGLFIISIVAIVVLATYLYLQKEIITKKSFILATTIPLLVFIIGVIVMTVYARNSIIQTNETISTQSTEMVNLNLSQTANAETIKELQATIDVLETTPSPTISREVLLVSEDFSVSPNPNNWNWDDLQCPDNTSGEYSEIDKAIKFSMNDIEGYEYSRNCYLPFRIENYTNKYDINKISLEVTLHHGWAKASFAGLVTSCGDTDIYFFLSPTYISYKDEYTEAPDEIHHHEFTPHLRRTLIIEWDETGEEISLQVLAENNPLIEPKSYYCDGFPQRIEVGVFTIQGASIQAEIDDIEIWGIEKITPTE